MVKPIFDDDIPSPPANNMAVENKLSPVALDFDTLNISEKSAIDLNIKPLEFLNKGPKKTDPLQVQKAVMALEISDDDKPKAANKANTGLSATPLDILDQVNQKQVAIPKTRQQDIMPSIALDGEEHPAVAKAMLKAKEKFPIIFKNSGFLIRNHLNDILPLSYDNITKFGGNLPERATDLIDQVTKATILIHEVQAADQIKSIIDRANHAKTQSLMAKLSNAIAPFDPGEANLQLSSIKNSLLKRLEDVKKFEDQLILVQESLSIHSIVMSIMDDMSDHGDIGGLVTRKGNMLNILLQEISLAVQQVKNIEKQVKEWVMRCDEVSINVLPMLGFRASLS